MKRSDGRMAGQPRDAPLLHETRGAAGGDGGCGGKLAGPAPVIDDASRKAREVKKFIELPTSAFPPRQRDAGKDGPVALSDGVPPATEATRWGWARDDMDRLSARGEKIGWVSGTDIYLDPGAAYTAAVAQAERMRTPLQTSRARVHKALLAAELLPSADPGHLTTKVSAGGGRPRVLHLKSEALTQWS